MIAAHKYPEHISELVDAQNWAGAIARLKKDFREQNDQQRLMDLRNLRMEAGAVLDNDTGFPGARACPPVVKDPFPDVKNNIPEIKAEDITPEILGGAMRHHGAIILRGFAGAKFCERKRRQIDKSLAAAKDFYTIEARDRHRMVRDRRGKDIWFSLFPQVREHAVSGSIHMMYETGAVWTFLSPLISFELVRFFEKKGLKSLFREYFDDEPCLSLNKSVLRRAAPLDDLADWHQDGAFMSSKIRSLNLWMALSDCGAGTDSPGMDIVPKRLKNVLPTGTNGAHFNWSVSDKTVRNRFKPVRPTFKEGDGLIFDHYNLHCTSYDKDFTRPRYAIETWFFAQNFNAANQTPAYW